MKYIIFSFDDGRKDTYEIAAPIILKNKLTASVHVVTGFIDGTVVGDSNLLIERGFMSIDNCLELVKNGFDISSHSNSHINDFDDINVSFNKLMTWGISNSSSKIGFSSPRSMMDSTLTKRLLYELKCEYIRNGTRIKDRSFLSLSIYALSYFLKSKKCFVLFNKKYMIKDINSLPVILPSVAIKSGFNNRMIKYLLNHIPENGLLILNFHSIVFDKIEDKWDFKAKDFEELCKYLSNNNDFKVINLKQLVSK